jgi:hypothetical protein
MTDFTWTGAAGDSSFGTAGNWTPTGVPDAASNITVPFGSVIFLTGNTTLESLSGSGGAARSPLSAHLRATRPIPLS